MKTAAKQQPTVSPAIFRASLLQLGEVLRSTAAFVALLATAPDVVEVDDEELLDLAAAAKLVDRSPKTLRKDIRLGRLAAVRPEGARGFRVRRSDLMALHSARLSSTAPRVPAKTRIISEDTRFRGVRFSKSV